MTRRPPRQLLGLVTVVWCACAAPDPRTAPPPEVDHLLAFEARLAREPPRYADRSDHPHADPEGVVVDADGVLWVWSRRHPRQVGLVQAPGGEMTQVGARTGPRSTRACLAFPRAPPTRLAGVVCVGVHEPGGLVAFERPGFASALPRRGGFVDLALDARRDRLHVLDRVDDEIWTLDGTGAVVSRRPAPTAPDRLALVADDLLVAFGAAPPSMVVWTLDGGGIPRAEASRSPRHALPRALLVDPARRTLWLTGPEDRPVRRDRGPIRHLRASLEGYRAADLATGSTAPAVTVDLGAAGLVDAAGLALAGPWIAVAATGSDRVALVDPDARRVVAVAPTGAAPVGIAVIPGGRASIHLAVASRLADAIHALEVPPGGGPDHAPTLAPRGHRRLAGAPREGLAALGERLFYSTALWPEPTADAFTCNSCHWDTGTDHRLQPGFREQRHEITRPLGGLGTVHPVFSTGLGDSLTDAVEGLVRALDDRFWAATPGRDAWWEAPRTVAVPGGGGTVRVDAVTLRQALLAFLMTRPVEPPLIRAPGAPFSTAALDGWRLFSRDCAGCHEPTTDMRTRGRPEGDPLSVARDRPLTWGNPAWARSGAAPTFHANGNRVTPLRDLGRGGPFFTDGSAATLRDVLVRARPGTGAIHGGRAGERSRYDGEEVEALRVFLLSI